MTQPERMMEFFPEPHGEPDSLSYEIERAYWDIAQRLRSYVQAGPERTVAFRKLLESRDAARRAIEYPGK